MPEDIVEIIPINTLPTAAPSSINLNTNIPVGIPSDPNSKKSNLQVIATVISEQIGSVTVPDPYFYRVDGAGPNDPPSMDGVTPNREVPDTNLDALDYSIIKWGVGPLRKGIEWQNDISGGGWRLLDADLLPNEMYVAYPKPKISNIISSPDAVARFTSGVATYPADATISATDYRKLIVINGAKSITLPDVSAYPENVALFISTSDGPQRQTMFITQPGQFIFSQSGTLNAFYLSNNEYAKLIRIGLVWYIVDQSDMVFKNPALDDSWLPGQNQFLADGTERNRADYPKVWAFIQKLKAANPAAVKTGAQWATNQTYWGEGNGTTTFNTPKIRGQFIRSLNGDTLPLIDADRSPTDRNAPGSLQSYQLQSHNHTLTIIDGADTAGGAPNIMTSGNVSGLGPVVPPATISNTGGTETRPINVGMFKVISY